MTWKEKFYFKKQSDGYTPLHISRSDQEEHVSLKGNEFMAHVYGEDFPWPIGRTSDKWLHKRVEKP